VSFPPENDAEILSHRDFAGRDLLYTPAEREQRAAPIFPAGTADRSIAFGDVVIVLVPCDQLKVVPADLDQAGARRPQRRRPFRIFSNAGRVKKPADGGHFGWRGLILAMELAVFV
jgi:hypothetical protein